MTGYLVAGLAAIALALLLVSRWLRAASGVPEGGIAYQDSGPDSPLMDSARYGLVGKPDYLVRAREGVVPVEVKPSRRDGQAHRSDILQVAAYCLLVEDTQASFGGYGVLRIGRTSHRVRFTDDLRAELLGTLEEMRLLMAASDVEANHDSAGRCRACSCRQSCGNPILQCAAAGERR